MEAELTALYTGLYAICGPMDSTGSVMHGNLATLLSSLMQEALNRLFCQDNTWVPAHLALEPSGSDKADIAASMLLTWLSSTHQEGLSALAQFCTALRGAASCPGCLDHCGFWLHMYGI